MREPDFQNLRSGARLDEIENRLDRILREPELLAHVGLRKTQVAALIVRGEFPKPLKLSDSGRAKGWLESEVIAWQAARRAKRDAT